jgi:anion-transporting  ArsA/GET3 family ATPase
VTALLDRRLVVVTGKGGVGKTTVAAALGLLAAGRGKRTIVCEVGEQERLAGMFGGDGLGYRERELAPGLHGLSVDPERAKEEWLRYQLRSGTLAGILGGSRIFQYLTAAAPGLNELVTIGKVWELAQLERVTADASPYDLVLLDAPATGHGLAMLRAPSIFSSVARVGPVHRQAGRIHAFLADRAATGVLAVALPEEIPVNETLDLERRLREEMALPLELVVVNGLLPERFSPEEARRLESLDGAAARAARPAVRAALGEHRRARMQHAQLRRLRRGIDAPVTTLPFVFEAELETEQLQELAGRL